MLKEVTSALGEKLRCPFNRRTEQCLWSEVEGQVYKNIRARGALQRNTRTRKKGGTYSGRGKMIVFREGSNFYGGGGALQKGENEKRGNEETNPRC